MSKRPVCMFAVLSMTAMGLLGERGAPDRRGRADGACGPRGC
jgi:hypothetical protein